MNKIKTDILLIILMLSSAWLRLSNLGYSDYQGDEIKALFLPLEGQNLLSFLFAQRKGPVQFLITYLIKFINPSYTSEFLTRLPFAFAGIFAVFFFYKFVMLVFSKKIAIYSALILSFNGLFVAFSRIAQYQSFVILFSILALYLFALSVKSKEWMVTGLYLGSCFWALAILSHYDGVFIAPAAFYFIYSWFKTITTLSLKKKVAHLLGAGTLVFAIVGFFYIPFLLSVSDKTKDYWLDRVEGGEGKLSSSIITFKVYNPKYVFYIYAVLFLFSLFKIKRFFLIFVWLLFPFIFMEYLINVPGTHIYNYLMPLSIIAAFGITFIENVSLKLIGERISLYICGGGLVLLAVFLFLLTYVVFVDHKQEYPWEEEKFLFWTLRKPNVIFHLSMFGFPYYRHWEEIGALILSDKNTKFYSTNERKSIARYFVKLEKDTDSAGYYVYVLNPQTFTNEFLSEKVKYWATKNKPIKSYFTDGREVAKIYLMPAGTLDSIKRLGY